MEQGRGSRTAEVVAARRAAHQLIDRPLVFTDPLALAILRPETAAQLKENPRHRNASPLAKALRAALVVRSRFAEDELRHAVAAGVHQYVLLGAGFDTFAYRNPFSKLRVFEVDHPSTQAVKRARLEAAGIAVADGTTYVPIDFTTTELADALADAGFDMDEPAFFAWLGVVPYLEMDAIRKTLTFIASRPPGTVVVFDYGASPASLSWIGRFVVRAMQKRLAAIGEPWKTFFTPAEVIALLREVGFRSAEDWDRVQLNERYFANRSDGLRMGEAAHIVKGVV